MSADLDARVAAAMNLHAPQVSAYREEWNRTPQASVIRTLFSIALEDAMKERLTKLRRCNEADLKKLQGELDGLELAKSILSDKTTTTT